MNVNPFSYLIEKLKGKVDKSGDTMSGTLKIDQQNGTISTEGYSYIHLGNSTPTGTDKNSTGSIRLFASSGKYANIVAGNLTANRAIAFPDNGGTVALTSDITTHSINTEVAWGSSMSISRSGANSMLITGGRQDYGFQVFIPRSVNDYVILSNVNSCLNSISVVGDTITLTVRSSGYGSKCQIFVLWN